MKASIRSYVSLLLSAAHPGIPFLCLSRRSAIALAAGQLQAAIDLSQIAANYENAGIALPTTSPLYFTPGTAYQGALALRVASVAAAASASPLDATGGRMKRSTIPGLKNTTVADLLSTAASAFEQCLEGRTKLPLCQLGAARSNAKLGGAKAKAKAQSFYRDLVATWGGFKGQPARKECSVAWREAKSWA